MLVVHVAPHPDDELLGAPATLLALRDAGHRIRNVACSLGRPADAARREDELREACRRAGFAHAVVARPLRGVPHAPGRERDAAEARLAADLAAVLAQEPVGLVVGPSPHDRHPGHELVARALLAALGGGAGPDRCWLWGLWGALPFPTTVAEFGPARLEEIRAALAAHAGELARNDYARLLEGRARAATVLTAELAFGFGAPGIAAPFAEATCEVVRDGAAWRLGAGRALDPRAPFPPPGGEDLGWWLRARSAADTRARQRQGA